MANQQVLIVGAGPTGMTAAIELKRLGMDVRVIDKSDHLARYSQALVLQARTLEQLQRCGLAEEAIARGRKLNEAKFYSEGKLIVDFKLDHMDGRYPFALFLPQSETEKLLNECMESLGVRTERGVELLELKQDPHLHAMLRQPDGRTEEITPRWVIGADGAHSTVREKMGVAFEGGGVGLSFFLGDCEIEGPDVPGDELSLHVRDGDVLFMGRLSDRIVRLIVATHEQQSEENREITIEDLQRAVDRIGARVKIRSAEWLTPFHVNDRQAKHYRMGNVFLAGDASHIHSPVGGQGMNTGMQDAANLAWKIAAVARGASDTLLDSYEEERAEVGRALLRFTERGLKLATTTNPVLEKARDILAPLLTMLDPVQHRAVGFISETAIEYRSSSIVHDYGGDGHLRAGDRVPDLALHGASRQTSLLEGWTAPRHRVFGLNLDQADIQSMRADLPNADVVALATTDLEHEGRRLFGDDGKIFVLRPDGYLGFRSPMGFRVELLKYAQQEALDGFGPTRHLQ
jgi:2-polyprenyl-6-methoxyphenol hydroxylase-like FAD-dependent oxidoreductase